MVDDPRRTRTPEQLAALGVPAFGIALAYTVATTYLPVLIERLSGPGVTGFVVGCEGVLSLFVPVLIGAWSDAARTRMPFVEVGAVLAVAGLLVMPATTSTVFGLGAGLGVFFLGYFVYHSPYYALFPDLVPDSQRGRSQGVQGAFRSVGMLGSLAAGGLLMQWWLPLPFVVGALAIAGSTAVLARSMRHHPPRASLPQRSRGWTAELDLLRRDADIRRWAVANALWETAVGGLRVFVVLYFTRGLGLSLAQVSGALAMVGAAAVVAAPISGRLADRLGHLPVMEVSLWVFAVGLLPAVFTTDTRFITAILPVAFAAVVLLTLPYSVLMGLLPTHSSHGTGAGLYGVSRGVGVLMGPLLAGYAVELFRSADFLVFARTDGYSAVFALTSVTLLASIPLLRRMRGSEQQRQRRNAA